MLLFFVEWLAVGVLMALGTLFLTGLLANRGLRLDKADAMIDGVCAGLGVWANCPAWIWRVGFVVLFFCHCIGALIVYLGMAERLDAAP